VQFRAVDQLNRGGFGEVLGVGREAARGHVKSPFGTGRNNPVAQAPHGAAAGRGRVGWIGAHGNEFPFALNRHDLLSARAGDDGMSKPLPHYRDFIVKLGGRHRTQRLVPRRRAGGEAGKFLLAQFVGEGGEFHRSGFVFMDIAPDGGPHFVLMICTFGGSRVKVIARSASIRADFCGQKIEYNAIRNAEFLPNLYDNFRRTSNYLS
jgi:hypothetical protein